MEQHKLVEGNLLDEKGNLCEKGYSFCPCKKYNRNDIKVNKFRIKEWDYYYVGNKERGLALTVADNGYMALASVTVFDFRKPAKYVEKSIMSAFPLGKLGLPSTSEDGDVEWKKGKISFSFIKNKDKRRLIVSFPSFGEKKEDFHCDLTLTETTPHSMVIATPFDKKGHFYYNQKINNQKVLGYAKVGDELIDFSNNTYGVLDWGRGVWTYKNTWYWSSLNWEDENGLPIGFNLGYGFGDTSAASENVFFYGKDVYKLGIIKMDIPLDSKGRDDFLSPWHFRGEEGSVDLIFTPVLRRKGGGNALIIISKQNQIFGTFSGKVIIEGKEFLIKDYPGFAEKVFNCW